MKKFMAINGSPRKNGNTAELLKHAVQGALDAGADVELVNLYAPNFSNYIYSDEFLFPKELPTAYIFCAFNTVQFKDYSRYESSLFNAEEKFAYRDAHFADDCAAACDIGRDLVSQ